MSADPDIDRLNKAIFGNGKPGLIDRMDALEGAFFANHRTGDIGVIARLKKIETFVTRVAALMGVGGFLLGVAVSVALRLLGG